MSARNKRKAPPAWLRAALLVAWVAKYVVPVALAILEILHAKAIGRI